MQNDLLVLKLKNKKKFEEILLYINCKYKCIIT